MFGKKVKVLLVGILFLLSLFPLLNVSAATTIDMVVVNESIQTAQPDGSVIYYINITNRPGVGGSLAKVNLTKSGVPEYWTAALSQETNITIDVGVTVQVSLTVGVPANATADSAGKLITITATDGNSGATSTVSTTTKVAQIYDFSLSAVDAFTKDVSPGNSVTYQLRLNQTGLGNGINKINLTPTGEQPNGLTISYSQNPVNVQPFSETDVIVTVFAPMSTAAQQYSFLVTATSSGGPVRTQNIYANVLQKWDIALSPLESVKNISPSETITFSINVTNKGNKADSFTISSIEFIGSAIGWSAVSSPSSIGPISPDSSSTLSVIVTAPANATYPNNVQIKVFVESLSNSSVKKNTTVTAVVTQVHKVYITSTPFIATALPKTNATFTITIENRGNGQDTFDLSIPSISPLLTPNFNTSSVILDSGIKTNVTLTVAVSSEANVGDIEFKVLATIFGTNVSTENNLIVRVSQVVNVSLLPAGTITQKIKPGSSVSYNVSIKNTGNGNDTYTMSATTPTGITTTFDLYSIDVLPGASKSILVTLTANSSVSPGTYKVIVKATSTKDSLISGSLELSAIVSNFGVELISNPPSTPLDPGKSVEFSIFVKNTGDYDDTYYVNVSSLPTGINATLQVLTPFVFVETGKSVSVSLKVSAVADFLVSNVTITVKASSQNSTANASVDIIVSIQPIYGIAIYADNTVNATEPSDIATYEIKVKNNGNAQDIIELSFLGSYRSWASANRTMLPIMPGNFEKATVTISVPDKTCIGNYTIDVFAISTKDTKKNASISLVVEVKEKHVIELIANDSIVSKRVEPGSSISYIIDVINAGPDKENVEITVASPHITWIYEPTFPLAYVLEPKERRTFKLSISVPPNALPEVFTTSLKASIPKRTTTLNLTTAVSQKYGLLVSSNILEISLAPNNGTNITLEIENLGTGDDNFTLVSKNYTTWVRFNPTTIEIKYLQKGKVNVSINVPISTVVGEYNITISVISVGNTTVKNEITIKVEVIQVYGLKVTSKPSLLYVDPGTTAKYTITVTNKGNGIDTFTLTKHGAHINWAALSDSSITLSSGESKTIDLTIQLPVSSPPETFTTNVTVKSQGNLEIYEIVSFTTTINLIYGVEIKATTTVKKAVANESSNYTASVKNTGNGNDTVLLEAKGKYSSWIFFNGTAKEKYSLFLGPGETVDIFIIVNIPWSKPYDTLNGTYDFLITASSANYSFASSNITLLTLIDIIYKVGVVVDLPYIETSPGSTVTYNFTIKNYGNIEDRLVLNVTNEYSTWVSFSENLIKLKEGESKTVKATVSIPSIQPDKNCTIEIEVKSIGNESVKEKINVYANVLTIYSIELTSQVKSREAGQGETIEITNIKVRNTGNVKATIDFEGICDSGWAAIPSITSKLLAPNEIEYITLTVSIPRSQPGGNYSVSLKGTIREKSSISATISFSIIINYGVDIVTKVSEGSGHEEENITFIISIKNTGTGNDTYELELMGSYVSWAELNQSTIALKKGETKEIGMNVKIPKASAGTYKISLKVTSRNDLKKFALKDFVITVKQTYKLSITTSTPLKEGEVGGVVSYSIDIKNIGNGEDTIAFEIDSAWATLSQKSITVPSGSESGITITISIPKDALNRSYPLTLKAKSKDLSTTQLSLILVVKQSYGIELVSLEPPTMEIKAGTIDSFTLTIKNNGNGEDKYSVYVSGSAKSWVTFSESQISIGTGLNGLFEGTVSIPSTATAGEYDASIIIYAGDKATSKNATLSITVIQEYCISIVATSKTETTIDPKKGDASYSVQLTNCGNGDDIFIIKTESMPTNWEANIKKSTTSVLQPGGSEEITITLLASSVEGTDPGDYYFIISAYSKSDAKISKSLKFKARVVKEEIKIVKIETSKTIATADDNIKITVYVENRGEGIGEKIPIIIKAGDEEVYSDVIAKISPNTTQTIVATWKAKPGTYQINVKVSTESGVGATLAVEEKKVLGLTTEYWSYVILVIIAIIIIGACIGFAVRKPPKVPERPTIPMPTPEPLPPLPTVPSIPVPPPEPKIEKVKIARIKCPKCGSIKDVTSPTRPIELRCEGCNAKLLLKK